MNDEDQYFYYQHGKLLTGWQNIDGARYYFQYTGILQSGIVRDGESWRYFYVYGSLATSTIIDGYEIDKNGVRK